MSLRRFVVYFFALCVCATAAFASQPSSPASAALDAVPPAAQVVAAR